MTPRTKSAALWITVYNTVYKRSPLYIPPSLCHVRASCENWRQRSRLRQASAASPSLHMHTFNEINGEHGRRRGERKLIKTSMGRPNSIIPITPRWRARWWWELRCCNAGLVPHTPPPFTPNPHPVQGSRTRLDSSCSCWEGQMGKRRSLFLCYLYEPAQ